MTIDPLPVAATADYLTQVLRQDGALGAGRSCDVAVERSVRKQRSLTLRLRLTYAGPAGTAPPSVILKTGRLDREGRSTSDNHREVAFYRNIASALSIRAVPFCFEARSDPVTKAWHLVLEDLTDSHFIATDWPLPPTMAHCAAIVEARARFHAAWWDDPRLSVEAPDVDTTSRTVGQLVARFGHFIDRHGDLLSRARRDLYEALFDHAPRLLARRHSCRTLTVVHGDAHVWNCFLPHDPGTDEVRLFDWEDWGIDIGTTELAYMMAMHWYPDRRRLMERPLLERYHAALLAHGVSGYDRHALEEDYRRSALWQIMRPLGQEANNVPARVWWNNLERALMAVDDLDGRALLG